MSKFDYAPPHDFGRSALSAAIISLSLGLSGCLVEGDKGSPSTTTSTSDTVTNPTHEFEQERQMTGIIQGRLRDRVTGNPIAGAVISIGLQQAKTDALGQYVLTDVPVTQSTWEGGNGGKETYKATIDLRNANSGTDYSYPDFYYDQNMSVTYGRFTTLEAENIEGNNFQQGTFHQAVSGLVTAHDMEVGTLSTTVSGKVVADINQENLAPHSALAGATVYLYHTDGDDLAERSNRVVAEATTDENGNFSFSNIEAGADLYLSAYFTSSDGEEYFDDIHYHYQNFGKMQGEEIKFTLLDGGNANPLRQEALKLTLLEAQGPLLASVSPKDHSNLTLDDTHSVEARFNFNRSVEETVYARAVDADSSAVEGLYNDVTVRYNGTKIDHQVLRTSDDEPQPSYTISWEDDYSVLVITMNHLVKSARYSVDISAANGKLQDSQGRAVDFAHVANATTAVVHFTTRTEGLPAIPEPTLAVSSFNAGDSILMQWAPVEDARKYRIYRQEVVLNDDVGGYIPGYWPEADDVYEAQYTYAVPEAQWNHNGNPKAFYFMVTAVNADGMESSYSEVVGPITDSVNPSFYADSDAVDLTGTQLALLVDEYTREMLDEEGMSIEVLLKNNDDGAITVTEVRASGNDNIVQVTLSEAIPVPTFNDLADEQLGQVRTGWNGVWREDVWHGSWTHGFMPLQGINEYPANKLPSMSTGLCMTVEGDRFFSQNSDDYADGIPLNMTIHNLAKGDDDIQYDSATDTTYIYTGEDGICNSVTALLNFYHNDVNNASNNAWITVAEGETSVVADNDYSDVATWALSEVSTAVLDTVTLNVTDSFFRVANRAETLTQLARATGFGWTDPADLSEGTLSELSQGINQSRPSAPAYALNAPHEYTLDGAAPASNPRPDVLYFDDVTQDNFAWRGTAGSPQTGLVAFEFKPNAPSNPEAMEELATSSGHGYRPYVLDANERSVDILKICNCAVEDLAGNANNGATLMRTYIRNEDTTTDTVIDSYRLD